MNVASASQKRAEGEEQKEGGQNVQGTRKPRDKGEAFDPNAPQKFVKVIDDDDDFTVVTNVKHAPTF